MVGAGSGGELRKLIGDLQDIVRGAVPSIDVLHTGPECGWCPLCQFVEVLRSDHPDASARVKEAGTAIIVALRAVLDAAAEPSTRGARDDRAAAEHRAADDGPGGTDDGTAE